MWKALLSLPKEARMSLVNSFSCSLPSPSPTALLPGQSLGSQQQSDTRASHSAGSSSQPSMVSRTLYGHSGSISIGKNPSLSVYPSITNVPSSNIQVVRPQKMMNPNISLTSSLLPVSPCTTASRYNSSQLPNTSWSNLPNRATASTGLTIFPLVDQTQFSTDLSTQDRTRGISRPDNTGQLNKSNLDLLNMKPGLLSSISTCIHSSPKKFVSSIAETPPRLIESDPSLHHCQQASQSSQCDDYRSAVSTQSCQNSSTDKIYAREIKPPSLTSVHPIVQVFLPCSRHSETNMDNERQLIGFSPVNSLSSQIQTFSDLSDDVEVSVEDTGSPVAENVGQSEEENGNYAEFKQKSDRKDYQVSSFNLGNISLDMSETCMPLRNYHDAHLVRKSTGSCKPETSLSSGPPRSHPSTDAAVKLSEPKPGSIKSAKIHYLKTKGELLYVPVGTPLKSFIDEHPLVQGICLHKGKREIKKQLAQLCRQCDTGSRMTSWRRGKEILERNRFDDYFELTEEGRREQEEVLGSRKRDQYVVNWYVWCPGHSNCKRKCGGYGVCVEKCKGMMHKQDRHNCSLMINMKLFLSDLSTWRVNITGSHVPPGSGVVWVPPALHTLQFVSSEVKGQICSREDVRVSPRKGICQKAGPLINTCLMTDAMSDSPATSPSPVKVCRGSAQASKPSVCIPSKKRISKMLSSLKRRRQERQSTLKTLSFRKEEKNASCDNSEIDHMESSNQNPGWHVENTDSLSGQHFPQNLSEKRRLLSSTNIFENFSSKWDIGSRLGTNYSDNTESQFLSKSATLTAVSLGDSLDRATHSETLGPKPPCSEFNIADGLEQPYLNANTLCEILQQANGQEIFDHQASSAFATSSCHEDHLISEVLETTGCSFLPNLEMGVNWGSSEMANSDKSLPPTVLGSRSGSYQPSSSSPVCLTLSLESPSSPFESSLHDASVKSESEAIASIVQSLCGASDLQTIQAIALHDPVMNQQYNNADDEVVVSPNFALLEALPSYQEATATLGNQLHPPDGPAQK